MVARPPFDDRVRDGLKRIGAAHGIRVIAVFGSAARGELGDDSDVDLLVEAAAGRSLLDLIAFEQEAAQLVGRTVDAVPLDGISPHLRNGILTESVPL